MVKIMDTFNLNSEITGDVVKTLQTSSSADVRLVISDKNWLETSAVDQLKRTAELPGMCCGVGMPDLHPGKGQPIGAAFITRNLLYPHLVGSDIGCGMGLWKLDVIRKKVKLDKWESRLINLDDPLPDDELEQRLIDVGMEPNHSVLHEIAGSANAAKALNRKFGTIGGGNHFAEIQQVNEIFNVEVLSSLELDQQSVVFLAHSGSRGVGQKILRNHVDYFAGRSLTTEVNNAKNGQRALTKYIEQHDYAVQWAVANRHLIAERFCERLGVKRKALLDVSHNTVTAMDKRSIDGLGLTQGRVEEIHQGVEKAGEARYWIHRKGASPTDQGLVMIPGSRGSLSYLVKPRVSNWNSLVAGGFSLAHGAGRKWKRSESRARLEKRYKVKDLEVTVFGGRVICKQRDLLYEEAPQAYKNISVVVDDLVQARMIDVIASFKPLITYKTRSK